MLTVLFSSNNFLFWWNDEWIKFYMLHQYNFKQFCSCIPSFIPMYLFRSFNTRLRLMHITRNKWMDKRTITNPWPLNCWSTTLKNVVCHSSFSSSARSQHQRLFRNNSDSWRSPSGMIQNRGTSEWWAEVRAWLAYRCRCFVAVIIGGSLLDRYAVVLGRVPSNNVWGV